MNAEEARGVSVLVVDDERALIEVMATALIARSYDLRVAYDGRSALAAVEADPPDIVLLDLGLPDMDGLDVCREMRRWFANPIIILSADGADDRKVDALDAGADDYVTKPFSMPELLARLRVALRHRRLVAAVVDGTVLTVGALTVDTGAHLAMIGGNSVPLTRKEFALLALLARNVGRVVAHDRILDLVWDAAGPPGTQNSLRVLVNKLRGNLGTAADVPRVSSEPGVGYRLDLDGTVSA